MQRAKADQDDVVLNNVIKATGLSEKEARELLLMSDDDLDALCEIALTDKNESPARTKRRA